MQLDKELVMDERVSYYRHYILIIGILAIAFALSFVLRAHPLDYGFELAEFDPFFNYRATQFIVENGLPAYLEWDDDLSWSPWGRNVSDTSQVVLHLTASTLYQIFGAGSSLYDFVIWFPAVIGSLTTVIIFGIVRTIGGTTAGLLSSIFFAVSPIIILRGSVGWFKSEPLGLFYGLLAVYLLISGIKSDKGKISIAKIVGAGIILALGVGSWGGIQFFILPIGLFFIALPFLRKDNKFIILTSIIFTTVFLLTSALFEKSGIAFVSSLNGLFLIGCTILLTLCVIIKKIGRNSLRNGFALLGGAIITGIIILSSNVITLPSFRYLNAGNPFLIASDMLTDSVAEHATTTTDISFYFLSVLMIFAGIGAWFLFHKKTCRALKIKDELVAFVLIIGFLGIYFSSAFVRLEIFGSIAVIILSSIGISILISKILESKQKSKNFAVKISFLAVILALLVVPMVYPEKGNWSNHNSETPITILNSGTHFNIATNDWPSAMKWLKENTSEDDVIAAWWDYGYWISTLAERPTLADNSTTVDWQIRKIAATYFSTPDAAWHILTNDRLTDVSSYYVTVQTSDPIPIGQLDFVFDKKQSEIDTFKLWKNNSTAQANVDPRMIQNYPTLFDYWKAEEYVIPPVLGGLDADYIIVNIAVEKLSAENVLDLYTLKQKGGDESKAFWFMKIANLRVLDYYNNGLDSYTDKFWNETLLGQLIPLTPIAYVDPNNTEIQSKTFKPGYMAIYVKDVKFPANGNGPFELVYVPPSFERDQPGPLTGPLIYKINQNYIPNQ